MSKKSILFAGPILTVSGYGARARDLAKALIDNDEYDVSIIALRWGGTPQTALNIQDPEDAKILSKIVSPEVNIKPDVFIHLTIPNEFQALGQYNIGITAGIETDMCKPEWIEGCNKMDLVLTSSSHSKEVFEAMQFEKRDKRTNQTVGSLSLEKPCEVLFEGIDTNIYNGKYDKEIELPIDDIPEKHCILSVGHWLQGALGADRKDIGGLVYAFMDEFKKKPINKRPALVLKTSGATFSQIDKKQIKDKIKHIQKTLRHQTGFKGKLPNVYVIHGSLTNEEVNNLYNHPKVKAFATFTHGEGFGRPLLEFMTTGKPLIAPEWSGQKDFLKEGVTFNLQGELQKVHSSAVNEWILQDSKWYYVDHEYARAILNQVANDDMYKEMLQSSRKSKKYVKDNFTLKHMADKLYSYVSKAPSTATVKLPKLKKKKDSTQPAAIKLPKLKKVTT